MVFYIYKLVGINYVGSTIDIKRRTLYHRGVCYNEKCHNYNYLVYQYIREKEMNIKLEILFCYKKDCSDRIQKLVEQYYINLYNSKNNGLNTINAFGHDTEKYKEYQKKYDEKKKEQRKIKINCPKCKCLIIPRYLRRHQKTKKCKRLTDQKLATLS